MKRNVQVFGSNVPVAVPKRGGGAEAFSPLRIPNLAAWYDFADISTLWTNTTRTTPVAADGNAIQGVSDKSGNGRHLSEATNPPTFKLGIQNGRSVARFATASSNTLGAADADAWSTATQDITFFIVLDSDATTFARISGKMTYEWDFTRENPTGYRAQIFNTTDGQFRRVDSPSTTVDSWHAVTVRFEHSATTYGMYVDGTVGTSAAGSGTIKTNTAGALYFGHRGDSSSFWGGDIGEIIFYSSALSAADRARVENYLKIKWGTP